MRQYSPDDEYVGGFTTNDGSIDFYLRIKSIIKETDTILDLGAGRGAWRDDKCNTRVQVRKIEHCVKNLILADVDTVVLNRTDSSQNILIKDGRIPLPNASVDLIVCDYVLEHVEATEEFVNEISRVLKPGGWFCARTPHKYCYVAIIAKITGKLKINSQPGRKIADHFPTFYKLNTIKTINSYFKNYESSSFLFRSDPAYFFGIKLIYTIQKFFHYCMPSPLTANIFIFMRKIR